MMTTFGRLSAENKSNRKGKFKRFLLVNDQVGEKYMKRISIFDGLETRGFVASFLKASGKYTRLIPNGFPQYFYGQQDTNSPVGGRHEYYLE
jgi:hypothetical protein